MTLRGGLFAAGQAARLTLKVGSSLLVEKSGEVRARWLETLVADIAEAHAAGQQIILVSSGAIALGSRRLKLVKGGRASLEDAQAAAATGQIILAGLWADLLGKHGIAAAQMLVTLGDFEDRRRFLNASATLDRLLSLGVVPILNENDSVATEEIRFGDNDRLAARAAQAARADALVLLSDIDGLYTANPAEDPSAEFIPTVSDISAVAHMASRASSSGMGSGGMAAKVEAARIAHAAGVPVAIVAGAPDHPLKRFIETGHGTLFEAPDPLTARKAWLAGRMQVEGRLTVDAGAARALKAGKSLLAAGVIGIEGQFRRGDAVDVLDEGGKLIARGLVSYDAADARAIAGKSREALQPILGYAPRSAMIHRDQMVML
ncbi:glutamate 5-kinase [Sandaracinobacter sp.]|uniref:glutamate 5-kinase n=1 Tax=Sandaracinobacter sp. TaxID=2487581 RepID=UPI0035B09A11